MSWLGPRIKWTPPVVKRDRQTVADRAERGKHTGNQSTALGCRGQSPAD
jgi:hypothetical protein